MRSHNGDGRASWKALCDRFKSFGRPQLQQLTEKLTSLRKDQNETIVTLQELKNLQYNLSQVDEALSEQMFKSTLFKGLPKEFQTFCALVRFTKETKSLDGRTGSQLIRVYTKRTSRDQSKQEFRTTSRLFQMQ